MKAVFTQMLIPKKSARFLPWPGRMCLFPFTNFLIHVQEPAVWGTVKNEGSQPLPGAAVLVKPTSQGVTADADAKHFTFNQI